MVDGIHDRQDVGLKVWERKVGLVFISFPGNQFSVQVSEHSLTYNLSFMGPLDVYVRKILFHTLLEVILNVSWYKLGI